MSDENYADLKSENEYNILNEVDNELVIEVAEFFKIFGDPTRIKILHSLLISEKSVGDLAMELSMGQSAISHQLRTLRQSSLVKYRKEGKMVYYSLDDFHIQTILEQGIGHISHKNGHSYYH